MTLNPTNSIFKTRFQLSFFRLIQRKERLAQVGAAADRAAPRPGQAFTLAKDELTIEAGRRCQNQSLATGFQGFLQELQMIEDFTFGEADQL